MKTSSKATLLSALIFPGAGQLYLKRYRQGLPIMVIAVAGLAYIIWQATVTALNTVDSMMKGGNINMKELTDIAAKPAASSLYDNIILLVIIGCWVISIVDAYISGKERIPRKRSYLDEVLTRFLPK